MDYECLSPSPVKYTSLIAQGSTFPVKYASLIAQGSTLTSTLTLTLTLTLTSTPLQESGSETIFLQIFFSDPFLLSFL